MHKSRFKFFLIPHDQLRTEAFCLKEKLQEIFNAFDKGQLSEIETVFLLIALFCEKRRPRQWWMKGAFKNQALESNLKPSHEMAQNNVFLYFAQAFNLPSTLLNLDDFLLNYRFKNLPEGVFVSLYLWRFQNINLTLSKTPLSPLDMLKDQAHGKRVITVSRENLIAGQTVDGKRDPFEFILHDLCHAHLYFSSSHEEQKLFFTKFLHHFETQKSFIYNLNDDTFKADIEYIMSDMNSHYNHLVETFRGKLTEALRRKNNLKDNLFLNSESEVLISNELSHFI